MANRRESITFLIDSLRGGGAEKVCVTLLNSLAERGWNVTLVVLSLEDAAYYDRLSSRVNVVDLHKGHARTAFFALWKYLHVARPKKVLAFNHQLAVILVLIRMFTSLRFSIIARSMNTLSMERENEVSFWHKHVVGRLVRLFYGRVDHVIAQSSGMREDLIRNMGVREERITVINNPLNQEFEFFIREYDLSAVSKDNYILFVGKLYKQKAVHFAIEAFSRIVKDFPDFRLKIVGKGNLEEEFKGVARRLGIDDRVDFEGFQSDIIAYYLRAKATVLTSLYEGFPNVLVESIALGTPVVAFDCPSGPREIVREGVNGHLVRYKDVDHLTACLRRAIQEDWTAEDVRLTAKPFSSESIVRRYIDVLS